MENPDMENTDTENDTAPRPKRRLDARGKVLRRERILARLREGWTYGKIARGERLTAERVGQIVREAVGDPLRGEPPGPLEAAGPRPRPMRLLLEDALLEQIKAIAPLLDALDEFDRRKRARIKPVSREEARKTLLDKLDRASGKVPQQEQRKAVSRTGAARGLGEHAGMGG